MGFRNPITTAVDPVARASADAAGSDAARALTQIIPGTRLAADAIDGKTITGVTISGATIIGSLIRASGNGDAALNSTGHAFQAGSSSAAHVIIDGNEIMARQIPAVAGKYPPGWLGLNAEGGTVGLGPVVIVTDTGKVTAAALDLTGTGDAAAGTDGALVIGPRTGANATFDQNEIVYRNNGAVVGNGATQEWTRARFACGTQTITPVANTPTAVTVSFGKTFGSVPNFQVSVNSSSTAVTGIAYSNVTTTQATIYLTRTNTTPTGVNWLAVADASF